MFKAIEQILEKNAIDLFGVGNLKKYSQKLIDYGFPVSQDFITSISIGIPLLDPIVDKLGVDADVSTIEFYRHSCYELINKKIDNILFKISNILSQQDCDFLLIPASKTIDRTNLYSTFSHKAAAFIAGLGWIGKSCLIINHKYGPRVRWGTILTNAPLKSTGKPINKNCGNCNICVDSCPAGAFTGINFKLNDKREVRYDVFKCDKYLSQRKESKGYRVCGICIKVCPFGKKITTHNTTYK